MQQVPLQWRHNRKQCVRAFCFWQSVVARRLALICSAIFFSAAKPAIYLSDKRMNYKFYVAYGNLLGCWFKRNNITVYDGYNAFILFDFSNRLLRASLFTGNYCYRTRAAITMYLNHKLERKTTEINFTALIYKGERLVQYDLTKRFSLICQ